MKEEDINLQYLETKPENLSYHFSEMTNVFFV